MVNLIKRDFTEFFIQSGEIISVHCLYQYINYDLIVGNILTLIYSMPFIWIRVGYGYYSWQSHTTTISEYHCGKRYIKGRTHRANGLYEVIARD